MKYADFLNDMYNALIDSIEETMASESKEEKQEALASILVAMGGCRQNKKCLTSRKQ